ncbi:MAG: chemotaxis protein CheX [Rhodoferax sp.]
MTDTTHLGAKVLLLETDAVQGKLLSEFCHRMGLIAMLRTSHDALSTLERHKDLAGVLLGEDLDCQNTNSLWLACDIHRVRPELPVFLRRTRDDPLTVAQAQAIAYSWRSGEIEQLEAQVERAIFSLRYPTALVDGIVELTLTALRSMFPNAQIEHEPPYVVHDRIIHGEVSTLIPIESTWCRGYMMLQTEESALRQGLLRGLSYEGLGGELNFRDLNNMLGETTNLIWGAFKNRYVPPQAFNIPQIQVPIVINHAHKYISFGSPDPQLCIRYLLTGSGGVGLPPLTIVQRFIFNLHWSPEEFVHYVTPDDDVSSTGELELF